MFDWMPENLHHKPYAADRPKCLINGSGCRGHTTFDWMPLIIRHHPYAADVPSSVISMVGVYDTMGGGASPYTFLFLFLLFFINYTSGWRGHYINNFKYVSGVKCILGSKTVCPMQPIGPTA
jgi:hypothetical protein